MQEEITQQLIRIYCFCDDFLQAWGWHDDPQVQMSTAEVMTVALASACLFDNNHERSRRFLGEHHYMTYMLSKSRYNRRLHAIPEVLWQSVVWALGEAAKHCNQSEGDPSESEGDPSESEGDPSESEGEGEEIYLVDSCPVPICDNMRISRCHLYRGKEYRGYCASKRRYYYGLKLHLLVTKTGCPVEFVLSPGEQADITGLKRLPLDLPAGARIMLDAGYVDYALEDILLENEEVTVTAVRRSNSKRPHPPYVTYLCQCYRKRIETTFSTLTQWFGRRLHAVTDKGIELKVALTVMAYAISV